MNSTVLTAAVLSLAVPAVAAAADDESQDIGPAVFDPDKVVSMHLARVRDAAPAGESVRRGALVISIDGAHAKPFHVKAAAIKLHSRPGD